MNVSELAKSAGLSASGVRWYERTGVLPPATRKANGYRQYTDEDRRLMRLVATLRRLGISPSEAGRLASLLLNGKGAGPEVGKTLAGHREAIRLQRDELLRLDVELRDLETTIAGTANGSSAGDAPRGRISVLFLCNANSGRSQMGEALLSQLGGESFDVSSAGLTPRAVSPFAVRALALEGIDWSGALSKPVARFEKRRFDYVITLSDSAREQCPALPGPHNALHWSLDDPARVTGSERQQIAAYSATVHELRRRLEPFIELARVSHQSSGRTLNG